MGIEYAKIVEDEKAIEAFKQAIRIKPDYAEAHYWLGHCYSDLGLHREALEAFKQAVRIEPDDAFTQYSLTSSNSSASITSLTIFF